MYVPSIPSIAGVFLPMLSSIPSKIRKVQLKIAVEAMTHLIGDNRSMNVIWLVVSTYPL